MKRLLLFLSALAVTWMAAAAGVPASPAKRPTYRYLFVIDNTSSLRAGTNAIQSSIYNILSTGAFGDMKPGDTFGIMSFNNGEIDSRFPMQSWNPRAITQLSINAGYYVSQIKFSGKSSNLDKAVTAIKEIAKESQLLTVFVFSDGKDVLYGTPFDLPISTIYIQYYPEMSKAHRPFLTTLVMATGEFDGWAVEPAGGRVSIPGLTDAAIARLPKPPAPPQVETALPKPVRPPPQSIIVHGPLPPERPVHPKSVPSIVPSPSPVVQVATPAPVVVPPPIQPMTVTLAPPPAAPGVTDPQPAPSVPAVATTSPAPVPQPAPVETKASVSPPVPAPSVAVTPATAPTPQPAPPAPAAITPPTPAAVVAPVAKAPDKLPVQPVPPAVPLAAGTQSAKSNSNMLIPAVLILIVGIGFFVLYLRAGRRSNGGSLISRSIDQNHR